MSLPALKYRLLVALPLLAAAALGLGHLLVGSDGEREALYRAAVLIVKGLAAGGAAAAAVRFLRSDYLRLAWLLTAICYALLFTKDFALGLGSRSMAHPLSAYVGSWRGLITSLANVSGVVGTFLLARAWQVAGIFLPGPPRARRLVFALGALLAVAIAGQALWVDLRALSSGNPRGLVALASDVGDILSMSLIAPVLMTAIALRGGLLAWPWALMAASEIGWLLYDAAGALGIVAHLDPAWVRGSEELFRVLACLYTFSSGVAQRWVMSDMRAPRLRPS